MEMLNIFKYDPKRHTSSKVLLEVKEGYNERHLTADQHCIIFGMKLLLDRVGLESAYYSNDAIEEEINDTIIERMQDEIVSDYIENKLIHSLVHEIAETMIAMIDYNASEGLYDDQTGELKGA